MTMWSTPHLRAERSQFHPKTEDVCTVESELLSSLAEKVRSKHPRQGLGPQGKPIPIYHCRGNNSGQLYSTGGFRVNKAVPRESEGCLEQIKV